MHTLLGCEVNMKQCVANSQLPQSPTPWVHSPIIHIFEVLATVLLAEVLYTELARW